MILEWNVFRYDINKKEIVVFNIFDNASFYAGVRKALSLTRGKYDLEVELKKLLLYYFGHKSEYEILLTDIHNVDVYRKVDIFTQVWNNRDAFVEYVWRYGRGTEV